VAALHEARFLLPDSARVLRMKINVCLLRAKLLDAVDDDVTALLSRELEWARERIREEEAKGLEMVQRKAMA
jgi:hypothetical protein